MLLQDFSIETHKGSPIPSSREELQKEIQRLRIELEKQKRTQEKVFQNLAAELQYTQQKILELQEKEDTPTLKTTAIKEPAEEETLQKPPLPEAPKIPEAPSIPSSNFSVNPVPPPPSSSQETSPPSKTPVTETPVSETFEPILVSESLEVSPPKERKTSPLLQKIKSYDWSQWEMIIGANWLSRIGILAC